MLFVRCNEKGHHNWLFPELVLGRAHGYRDSMWWLDGPHAGRKSVLVVFICFALYVKVRINSISSVHLVNIRSSVKWLDVNTSSSMRLSKR